MVQTIVFLRHTAAKRKAKSQRVSFLASNFVLKMCCHGLPFFPSRTRSSLPNKSWQRFRRPRLQKCCGNLGGLLVVTVLWTFGGCSTIKKKQCPYHSPVLWREKAKPARRSSLALRRIRRRTDFWLPYKSLYILYSIAYLSSTLKNGLLYIYTM